MKSTRADALPLSNLFWLYSRGHSINASQQCLDAYWDMIDAYMMGSEI